jgi:ribosomal protein L31
MQTRGYRNQLYRHPQVFYQNIVLTDGSSFKVMTSSPRKTYRLTRDKFNNPIWTGRKRSSEQDDQNQQLAKFRKSFSNTLSGEAGLQQLSEAMRLKRGEEEGNVGKINPAEGLFDMLEAEDAYVPTRGREKDEPLPTGQQKGGRT